MNKRIIALSILALHFHPAAAYDFPGRETAPGAREIAIRSRAIVAFSPNGQATNVIVDAIRQAKSQILVQAYSFTSKPILSALAQAKERGVDVEVIADRSNDRGRYSGATYMVNHGVPVWIDDSVHIAHNKVMIFDRKSVLTGSFNFSAAAQKYNAENILLVENSPELAAAYINDWQWRQSLSRKFSR
ncbi:MAG TPA: phospholipase D family protein [Burkholderiales bacterium]|nr:phospholipase D family protein [Burkholderiales bacterium]